MKWRPLININAECKVCTRHREAQLQSSVILGYQIQVVLITDGYDSICQVNRGAAVVARILTIKPVMLLTRSAVCQLPIVW